MSDIVAQLGTWIQANSIPIIIFMAGFIVGGLTFSPHAHRMYRRFYGGYRRY